MIAQAFVHEPDVVFIDEPLANLDPLVQEQVKRFLVSYAAGDNAVFVSTHNIDVAEDICTRVGIVADSQLVTERTITDGDAGDESLLELFLDRVSRADARDDADARADGWAGRMVGPKPEPELEPSPRLRWFELRQFRALVPTAARDTLPRGVAHAHQLFGGWRFAFLPFVIALLTVGATVALVETGTAPGTIVSGLHVLALAFGLYSGTAGFASSDMLENVFGRLSLLLSSSTTLPLSRRRFCWVRSS